jgi:hypothetical protein
VVKKPTPVISQLKHIFGKPRHNLDNLIKVYGSEQEAFNAIEKATRKVIKHKNISGVFEVRSPSITKPSPPNQIINKRPSIFDTHRRFFGNDFKRFCSAYFCNQGFELEDAQKTREEAERLKEQVAEFKEAYGQDFDEQIKNLAVEYEQTTDPGQVTGKLYHLRL